MNSQQAKCHIMSYLMYDLHYLGVFTESFMQSDVLGINNRYLTTEVEIKTQRTDLLNELHTISLAVEGTDEARQRLRQREPKYVKHTTYLNGLDRQQPETDIFIPNNYYIAMTPELYDHRIHAIPHQYGVMIIGPSGKIEVKQRAMKLHKESIDIEFAWKLVRKSSLENISLRLKLAEGDVNNVSIPKNN